MAGPIGIARIAGNVADTGILPLLLFIAEFKSWRNESASDSAAGWRVIVLLEGLYGRKPGEDSVLHTDGRNFYPGGFLFTLMAMMAGLIHNQILQIRWFLCVRQDR